VPTWKQGIRPAFAKRKIWTLNEHDATLGAKAKIDQLLSRVEALLGLKKQKHGFAGRGCYTWRRLFKS
jgi:hypothetical protein